MYISLSLSLSHTHTLHLHFLLMSPQTLKTLTDRGVDNLSLVDIIGRQVCLDLDIRHNLSQIVKYANNMIQSVRKTFVQFEC